MARDAKPSESAPISSEASASRSDARVELMLLGGFHLACDGAAITLPTRKAQALLAYLALTHPHRHEREMLGGLLWGEVGREQAQRSLRQTLFGIRKALPREAQGMVITSGRTVGLELRGVDVDALVLDHLTAATRAELERVVGLCRGVLLEGLSIDEAAFEEWLLVERNRYAERASFALAKLADIQTEEGALEQAMQSRMLWLRFEPWEESNHRALMRLYVRTGRRAAAIAQYQQCKALLAKELGVAPEPATIALYDELLTGASTQPDELARQLPKDERARQVSRDDDARRAVLARETRDSNPSEARTSAAQRAAFVGRERELTELRAAMAEAWAGRGKVALLAGEAGVGKSRLLEELAADAAREGALVLQGRCFESEQVLPFAPWVSALRGGELRSLSASSQLSAATRVELARLMPWDEAPQHDTPGQDSALRLFEAVLELLQRSAASRALLLLIDDLHWADEMSLRLLAFLGRRLSATPRIFIATTLRSEELREGNLLATSVGELSRTDCALQLVIAPLSQSDTNLLIQCALSREHGADSVACAQIWALSEGNPFVILEAARALAQGVLSTDVSAMPVPERVRAVVAGHIARLSSFERELVVVAAVVGREFDVTLLQAALNQSGVETAAAVEALIRSGVFKASGARLYFAHERIREVVYEGLTLPRRAALHGHVARMLLQVCSSQLPELYGRLAQHYIEADDPRAAVDALTRFADRAAQAFGLNEALAALAHAALLSTRLGHGEQAHWRLEIAVRTAKCLFHLGRFDEIAPCLAPVLEQIGALERPALSAQVHFWLGCANGLLGNTASAASSGERALAEAQRGNAVKSARRAHTLLAWEAAFAGRFEKGIEHGLAASVSLSVADAEPEYIASGWLAAGANYLYAGRHREALSTLSKAAAMARLEAVPRVEALALAWSGLACAERGERERARELGERALELASDPMSRAGAVSLLAHVHLRAGRSREALELAERLMQARQHEVRPMQTGDLLVVAEASLLHGDYARAATTAALAVSASRAAGHPLLLGAALRMHGQALQATGELANASVLIAESCELLRAIGAPFQLARSLLAAEALAHARGNRLEALAQRAQAEALYRDLAIEPHAAQEPLGHARDACAE